MLKNFCSGSYTIFILIIVHSDPLLQGVRGWRFICAGYNNFAVNNIVSF